MNAMNICSECHAICICMRPSGCLFNIFPGTRFPETNEKRNETKPGIKIKKYFSTFHENAMNGKKTLLFNPSRKTETY